MDPTWVALVSALITAIVALAGQRVYIAKVRNEKTSTHIEGFEKLTNSLQNQLTSVKTDLSGLHIEVTEVRERNSELAQENQSLKSEIQTKNEIIRGFTKWHELWESWFRQIGQVKDLSPPPDYTWQMREYLMEIERVTDQAQQAMDDPEERK